MKISHADTETAQLLCSVSSTEDELSADYLNCCGDSAANLKNRLCRVEQKKKTVKDHQRYGKYITSIWCMFRDEDQP